jgi:hypothetical protein
MKYWIVTALSTFTALSTLSALTVVQAIDNCATKTPPMMDILADQARMRRLQEDHRRRMQAVSCEDLCTQCINIPTYWHFLAVDFEGTTVLPHPTDVYEEYLNGTTGITAQNFTSVEAYVDLVELNMAVLNAAYAETPFIFTYANRDDPSVYMNETWSNDTWSY